MKFEIEYPTVEDLLKMEKNALKEFGVPDECMVAPILENDLAIQNLERNNFVCYKKYGEPIAWSVVLPTSKNTKSKFLKQEINEIQLFYKSIKNPSYESLYLFAVIVLPEYRQKGLAKKLVYDQIKYFQDKYKITDFFAWVFSVKGEVLIKSLEKNNFIKIDYISRM